MNRGTKVGLLFISLSLFFLSIALTIISKDSFSRAARIIPAGSVIGPFSIGGLRVESALDEVIAFYQTPVELCYQEQKIQVDPEILGFTLNADEMINELASRLSALDNAENFARSLFAKNQAVPISLTLSYDINPEKIKAYLSSEISPRYDIPATAKKPVLNDIGFIAGRNGVALDVEASTRAIESALISSENRAAQLTVTEIPEPPGNIEYLRLQLLSVIDGLQNNGQITEMVLIDQRTGEKISIARRDQEELKPEISFTAASAMKVPIMISSYVRMADEPSGTVMETLRLMITESKNDQTDWMMKNVIGGNLAPFTVTDDMKKMGLKNTFLAGYFYLGAPLLDHIVTEANSRSDVNLHPDVYNQTTAQDMATLMDAIYHCAKDGSGLLIDTFGSDINQHECVEMIDFLSNNHLPYLITAGIPDGTPIAHKHGWIEESDGFLHTMSNTAIVYSPKGDYILSIFTWRPENLIFDNGNKLFTRISAATYNYFNPSSME